MLLTSTDFKPGQFIPMLFTCDGENISPALEWQGVPKEARSLALICDDPDAPMGTWVHWIIINIAPATTGLTAGGPLPKDAVEIKNDFGRTSYGGPCPPSGVHRYFFKLYALDVPRLAGVTTRNCEDIFKQHSLARAELMGKYQRKK